MAGAMGGFYYVVTGDGDTWWSWRALWRQDERPYQLFTEACGSFYASRIDAECAAFNEMMALCVTGPADGLPVGDEIGPDIQRR